MHKNMVCFLGQAGLLTADAFLAAGWRDQCINLINSVPVVILSTLVTVPISMWLIPYRSVTRAGFYDARLLTAAQDEQLPEMPPL